MIDYPKKKDHDAASDIEYDISISAARADVVRADNVARRRTELVVEGANSIYNRSKKDLS